jgi:hypothetical protein
MRRDLERRLRHIEFAERAGSIAIEYWIFEGDGMVSGPHGERMTRDAFNHLQSRGLPPSGAVVVLAYPEDELL